MDTVMFMKLKPSHLHQSASSDFDDEPAVASAPVVAKAIFRQSSRHLGND
jgi:hypothetical protein